MELSDMIGATVVIALRRDEVLVIVTDRGAYVLTPEGECYASCYVQHLSGSDALAPGAVIRAVDAIDDGSDGRTEHGEYSVSDEWGHRITTSKGVCSIEMRVDHNGYYGGSLEVDQVDNAFGDARMHTDCVETPALGAACGCIGALLDDF